MPKARLRCPTSSLWDTGAVKDNIAKQLHFHSEAIDALRYTLDEGALLAAIKLLRNAEHVLIVGDGGSGCSAKFAFGLFQRLRIRCSFVSDPFHQLVSIQNLKQDDVLFTVCNTGRAKNTIDNLQIAKVLGKKTIGIVGMLNTPIVKYLDVAIAINLFEGDLFSTTITSHICEICAISILTMLYSLENPERETFSNTKLINLFDKKRVQSDERE